MEWIRRRRRAERTELPAGRGGFVIGQKLASDRLVGSWTVLDVLRGGFGVVYVVRLNDAGDLKVLKSFDERFLWSSEDRARFEREALTWVKLGEHPNVMPAKGIERIEGFPCVLTDYVPGGDLRKLIATAAPFSTEMALRFAFHLCDGLAHAHDSLGIVHRDVKPANCLVADGFTLRVTDFGLARAFEEGQVARSPGGVSPTPGAIHTSVAGTPLYMAPEQFASDQVLDTRADVYAFGAVLLEMVTGRTPSGPLRAHDDARRRLGDRHPLGPIVLACTSTDRNRRPSGFGDVRELLESVHRSEFSYEVPVRHTSGERSGESWVTTALSLCNLGSYQDAIDAVDGVLRRARRKQDSDVTWAKLWQVRGMALVGLGRLEEGIADHQRAVTWNPDEPTAWAGYGRALLVAGRAVEALQNYDKSIALAPLDHINWAGRASALHALGRLDEADEACGEVLRLEPRDDITLHLRAMVRRDRGDPKGALRAADESLSINPRSPQTLRVKANVLRSMARRDAAREVLRDIARIHETDATSPNPAVAAQAARMLREVNALLTSPDWL